MYCWREEKSTRKYKQITEKPDAKWNNGGVITLEKEQPSRISNLWKVNKEK